MIPFSCRSGSKTKQRKNRSLVGHSSIRTAMATKNSKNDKISFSPNGYYDENTDIMEVDQYVKDYFKNRQTQIPGIDKQIQEKRDELGRGKLSVVDKSWIISEIKALEEDKEKLISVQPFYEYQEKISPIIGEWKTLILSKGPYVRFGEEKKFCPGKLSLIRNFIQVASNYAPLNLTMLSTNEPDHCSICRNPYSQDSEGKFICEGCGIYQDFLINSSDYSDLGRVSTGNGNDYNNQETFIKALMNYQGKQDAEFPDGIFEEFTDYCNRSKINMSTLNQETTRPIFKKLGYRDSYEDINLFLFILIQRPLPDVTQYETILLQDYDLFSQKYNEVKKHDRESALGAQYVLFILMIRRKIPCKREDFRLADTPSIRISNDNMARRVFRELGWIFKDTI